MLLLADGEVISDWIERGYCSQWAAAGADQVTFLCLSNTDDSVNRRNDAGKTEVDAGDLDLGLAGLNLSLRSSNGCLRSLDLGPIREVRLGCVIKVLLADRIHPCQGTVLLHIQLTLELVRLRCTQLRLILNQLGL